MKQPGPVIGAIILMVLATVFQAGFLDRYVILGAQVNLPLVVLISFSLISRPGASGALGFFSGVLTGGLSGATLTHYALSRVLAGYIVGTQNSDEHTWRSAMIWVFLGSVIAQIVLIILAPPSPLGSAVGATLLSAVYNGVVAIPVFTLVVRLFQPKVV